MSVFKGYPEINFVEGQADGLHRIETNTGKVIIAGHFDNPELGQRLVDCWNAVRKIFAPAAHIEATDDYVDRLEKLRKEAVARIEQLGAGASPVSAGWSFDISTAPLDARVWLATKCGKVSATYWDAKRSAWSGLADKEQPVAWQMYIRPSHPGLASDEVAA